MGPGETIVAIVAIIFISIASIYKTKRRHGGAPRIDTAEQQALRNEVKALKDRIQVLERITVEKENSLERQIEQLRER